MSLVEFQVELGFNLKPSRPSAFSSRWVVECCPVLSCCFLASARESILADRLPGQWKRLRHRRLFLLYSLRRLTQLFMVSLAGSSQRSFSFEQLSSFGLKRPLLNPKAERRGKSESQRTNFCNKTKLNKKQKAKETLANDPFFISASLFSQNRAK